MPGTDRREGGKARKKQGKCKGGDGVSAAVRQHLPVCPTQRKPGKTEREPKTFDALPLHSPIFFFARPPTYRRPFPRPLFPPSVSIDVQLLRFGAAAEPGGARSVWRVAPPAVPPPSM